MVEVELETPVLLLLPVLLFLVLRLLSLMDRRDITSEWRIGKPKKRSTPPLTQLTARVAGGGGDEESLPPVRTTLPNK
jgi:hypothetical protein